jgi:tape measure domain-containing protein
MAKLGDLVVRIGADTRDLNKSLGRVQRNMRSMSSNFERLGQSMTRSLTLPIAAFGAAAVKSAADLETLETSFVSLTGGAQQAAMMMQQLNEFTANTPFQIEAVANAARQLIASGTEVSQVNTQLQFLGDIAATSGSSIEEIAAIFAKVNAKGKVELENLNQLAERGIPIFKALADATGLPADALGAGAVSVDEFNRVLQGFAEQGGFAAGAMDRLSKTAAGRFSTALDNAKLALANVGEQVLPFVNEGLQKFTTLMQGLARLSPTTIKLAGAIAAVAASIGPLVTLLPKIIAGVNALKASFLLTTPAILGVAAVAGIIIGLFGRIAKEARSSAAEVREVERAIEDLTKTELARELGVTRDADKAAVQEAIADALSRVAEANAELARIEEKIQRGGAGLRAVYANKIADIKEYRATFERAVEAGERLLTFFEEQTTRTTKAAQSMSTLTVRTLQQNQANKQLQRTTWNVGQMVKGTTEKFIDMGDVIRQALSGIASAFDGTGNFIMKGLRILGDLMVNIGNQMIQLATAMKAFRKFIITNPGLAIAAGVGFVIAGTALSNMAQRNLEMPALAEGGVAFGPTMALIGDNKNASIDPEVVAPLSKLRDMMGGNQVEVFGRISGNDIFLSNARAGTNRNRYA